MADILVADQLFNQMSGPPTQTFDQLSTNNQAQGTSQACLVDLTPPTFAGIASLILGSKGQFRAAWLAGTDVSTPVRYEIYIKAANNTSLFTAINLVAITDKLQFDVFTTPDGELLQSGTTYFVGVKAVDAVGNRDANTVSFSAVSTGVGVVSDAYGVNGAFVINGSNQLQGTLWATKNGRMDPDMVLGLASFQVYDKTGAIVSGMSGNSIAADANGQYKITPVASTLAESLDHYMVKITINVDAADRVDYVALIEDVPDYDIGGFFVVDAEMFDGSFWVAADDKVRTTGLGSGSYQVFDQQGVPVSGMSASGISADGNGVFKITAIASTITDPHLGYTVRVTVVVDGISRSDFLPIQGRSAKYEVKGVFSINALNQLRITMWAIDDGQVTLTGLGAANYTVYDADGTAVSGLSEAGIVADVNGRYKSTPVSAALIADLTHYTVKLGVMINGVERVSYRGFSLLGN